MPRAKRRHLVLLVQPGTDFRPTAIGDCPDTIEQAFVDENRFTYCQAVEFCRVFNGGSLAASVAHCRPVVSWALIVRPINPEKTASPQAVAATVGIESKGGAA